MKADRILTEAAQPALFMKGVAWACQFLREADSHNHDDTGSAAAMYREGRPQAQLLFQLVAAMNANPELLPGANAILTEYLCLGGEHGAGVMSVDAFAAMTFEDFTREAEAEPDEDCTEPPSNVIPFRPARALAQFDGAGA